ncbi:MAG: hypothetical protein IT260_10775 [Saprospiraceae bacterium]|nr:hypothetical protein [Saprospiraceae bacterium]
MAHVFKLVLALAVIAGAGFCRPARPSALDQLLTYFPPTARDTMLFEVEQDEGLPEMDTIPNALFFGLVGPALMRDIDYLADSASAVVLGRARFPLNDSILLFWVDIRQAWFQHQSLLAFHTQQKVFTNRTTVAEWFGGDGGQVLTGAWMLDYDGDGVKDLIRRDIEHAMIPEADTAREMTHESAMLLKWSGMQFREMPLSDTALVIKQWPIRSFW